MLRLERSKAAGLRGDKLPFWYLRDFIDDADEEPIDQMLLTTADLHQLARLIEVALLELAHEPR